MTTEPRAQVQNLIRDLKIDGRIYKVGATKGLVGIPGDRHLELRQKRTNE